MKGRKPNAPQGKSHEKPNTKSILRNSKLWMAIFIPWLLDFFSPNLFLTTLVGASLWYLLLASSILQDTAKDKDLKGLLKKAFISLWILWLLAFAGNLFLSSPSAIETMSEESALSWLIRIHATLLAGSAGLVLLGALSSLAWLLQMRRVKAISWQRRQDKHFKLPSLESLSNLSKKSSTWAFFAWGVGLSLAVVSLTITRRSSISGLLGDLQIVGSFALWGILFIGLRIQKRKLSIAEDRRQWLVAIVNTFFWCLLLILTYVQHSESFHGPIRWLTQ